MPVITTYSSASFCNRKAATPPLQREQRARRVQEAASKNKKRQRRNLEQRKAYFEAERWAKIVSPYSVKCIACGKYQLLETDGPYYTHRWDSHRDSCKRIKEMEMDEENEDMSTEDELITMEGCKSDQTDMKQAEEQVCAFLQKLWLKNGARRGCQRDRIENGL
ncbi:hypothetical protein H0H81_005210 [Sphagnurus paluster]|uniref:Uncharacterized protein n=1 Tax=Sphagnurus paluster TaxID=117069 RepID=A0A9P7KL66_9AGAR|nr:hypothetical protein H0H81_005210 [Sphagnurus paluster]